MQNYNYKYYEPLEQMIAVRHQYMSKIIKKFTNLNIYEYLNNKKILDIGCGTGEFLKNYHDLDNQCIGIDIQKNFKFKNINGYILKNIDLKGFIKNNKKKFDVIFLFEFLEHLNLEDRKFLFKNFFNLLNKNSLVFISTLNKNIISRFFSIEIAEKYLKLLPQNTHEYKYFIKPSEIKNLAKSNQLSLLDISGMSYNPIFKSFKLSNFDIINYFGTLSN
jgi:2-polyprenyl-6-hydroxyphenyl methylase/3-demethylubiquinone-9 3-methyltransferase